MPSVYLSATREDLGEHCDAVSASLQRMEYKVITSYVARDATTVAACQADVDRADIYVGIFAWRYGHRPRDGNRSFTEIEYRHADKKPRLLFLLSPNADWPDELRDPEDGEDGLRIRELRDDILRWHAMYFDSPADLTTKVLEAIFLHQARRSAEPLQVFDELRKAEEVGASYLPNIQHKLVEVADAEIAEFRLGPTPWWTTRLHLVAALATDFTRIRQFLFLEENGEFVAMAPPEAVRRALAKQFPPTEVAYMRSLQAHDPPSVDSIVGGYQYEIWLAHEERPENEVKQDLTGDMLQHRIGLGSQADWVEQGDQPEQLLAYEILQRATPYVVLVRNKMVDGIVDRDAVVERCARRMALDGIG